MLVRLLRRAESAPALTFEPEVQPFGRLTIIASLYDITERCPVFVVDKTVQRDASDVSQDLPLIQTSTNLLTSVRRDPRDSQIFSISPDP